MKIETSVAVQLGRLGFHAQEIERLVSISRSLHRIAERQCNGYASTDWGRSAESRDERREARLLAEAAEIAAKGLESVERGRPLKVYHQGDPRGCALYVYDPARLVELSKLWGHEAKIDECYSSAAVPVY